MAIPQIPPDQTEEEFFRKHVPEAFLRALARAIAEGCIAAYDEASARDPEFFLDAVPSARRLKVEPILSKMLLPAGFESEIVRTPSSHYTMISADEIVITAVSRSKSVKSVRPYRYRGTLARRRQEAFFFAKDDLPKNQASRLYALLVYGGRHRERIPTEARFVFPTVTGTIESDGINLRLEYADIFDSYKDVSEPGSGAEPSLKKEKKEEGEDE